MSTFSLRTVRARRSSKLSRKGPGFIPGCLRARITCGPKQRARHDSRRRRSASRSGHSSNFTGKYDDLAGLVVPLQPGGRTAPGPSPCTHSGAAGQGWPQPGEERTALASTPLSSRRLYLLIFNWLVDTPAQRPYTGAHPARCTTDARRHGRIFGQAHAAALRRPQPVVTCRRSQAWRAVQGHGEATLPSGTPQGATSSWTVTEG